MVPWRWVVPLLAAALLAVTGSEAQAGRVPSYKAIAPNVPGARGDITVPFLTNGRTTLGVYNGVAPRIYATPIVNNPAHPQVQPVFNLIFYGARQAFGDGNNGATPRPPQNLRR